MDPQTQPEISQATLASIINDSGFDQASIVRVVIKIERVQDGFNPNPPITMRTCRCPGTQSYSPTCCPGG